MCDATEMFYTLSEHKESFLNSPSISYLSSITCIGVYPPLLRPLSEPIPKLDYCRTHFAERLSSFPKALDRPPYLPRGNDGRVRLELGLASEAPRHLICGSRRGLPGYV